MTDSKAVDTAISDLKDHHRYLLQKMPVVLRMMDAYRDEVVPAITDGIRQTIIEHCAKHKNPKGLQCDDMFDYYEDDTGDDDDDTGDDDDDSGDRDSILLRISHPAILKGKIALELGFDLTGLVTMHDEPIDRDTRTGPSLWEHAEAVDRGRESISERNEFSVRVDLSPWSMQIDDTKKAHKLAEKHGLLDPFYNSRLVHSKWHDYANNRETHKFWGVDIVWLGTDFDLLAKAHSHALRTKALPGLMEAIDTFASFIERWKGKSLP